jgi:Na+/proline symporter
MAGTLLKRFCTVAWAFLGLGALALYPALSNEEHAFGHLVRDLLPPGLTGLMLAAILAAVMSTCDAMMLSGSALITRNLYGSWNPGRPEAHYVGVGRIASAGVVAAAAALGFLLPSVLDGLKQVWTFYAFMGLAWWAGVIWYRATTTAAWTSTIATALAYGATLLYNHYNNTEARDLAYPEQIAIYLACGAITLIVTSFLTSHSDPQRVQRFYRKMRTPTTVPSEFDAEE